MQYERDLVQGGSHDLSDTGSDVARHPPRKELDRRGGQF